MVTELLVTNKSIAIIFQTVTNWKIAFGEDEKKIFEDNYPDLQIRIAIRNNTFCLAQLRQRRAEKKLSGAAGPSYPT